MTKYLILVAIYYFSSQLITHALVVQSKKLPSHCQSRSEKLRYLVNCSKLQIQGEKFHCNRDKISKFTNSRSYLRTVWLFGSSSGFESDEKDTNGIWKFFFLGNKKLSDVGQSAFLAYALVSNICTVCCFTVAWISHGRIYHCSPFSKNQWKTFGLIYAGIWTANNLLRPLRISAAIALSPLYDKAIDKVSVRTGLERNASCVIIVLCVNVLGTLSALALGALIGSKVAKVPLLQLT